MNDATELPDGSGFFTGSFPLPKDHWIYAEGSNVPPMLLRCGTADPRRAELEQAIREGVRYALKASTMNGQDDDYDPDAVVQNAIVGIIGYFTPDGTDQTSDVKVVGPGGRL
tara:strand:- start:845 stop:1180 length:336 start_codon:yes stop_codon:yes gene_type:complete